MRETITGGALFETVAASLPAAPKPREGGCRGDSSAAYWEHGDV